MSQPHTRLMGAKPGTGAPSPAHWEAACAAAARHSEESALHADAATDAAAQAVVAALLTKARSGIAQFRTPEGPETTPCLLVLVLVLEAQV